MIKDPAAALADESPVNPSEAVLMLGALFQGGTDKVPGISWFLLVELPMELPWDMDEVAEVTARLEVDDDYKIARLAVTGGASICAWRLASAPDRSNGRRSPRNGSKTNSCHRRPENQAGGHA